MQYPRINCRQFEPGGFCKDPRVKRSLFGFGARLCETPCPHQDKNPRPAAPPAPPLPVRKEININVKILD